MLSLKSPLVRLLGRTLVLVVLLTGLSVASAGTLSVSSNYDATKKKATLTITDPQYKGMDVKITQNKADGSSKVVSKNGDTINNQGEYSITVDANLAPIFTVHIGPANGGDTWVVIRGGQKLGKDGKPTTISFEERNAQDKAKGMQGNLGGSPLNPSTSVFFANQGHLNYGMELVNPSTTSAYALTSLTVYQDLNLSYFTPSLFASSQAIATGSLAIDTGPLGNMGSLDDTDAFGIPKAGGSALPILDIGVPNVRPDGYELILGDVAPVADDGTLGTPVPFAFGQTIAPEPATWVMALSVLAGLLGFWWIRKNKIAEA
jgi:hypothetical protein